MTAKTNNTPTLVTTDNSVPDYTSKAKARREMEKSNTMTVPSVVPGKHIRFPPEIVDYSPPCISPEPKPSLPPRGSIVGHFHSPSLIAVWKQLDEIY
jgi:hypothetical protein